MNKRRKAKKAAQFGDRYVEKWKYKKAILNYKRSLSIGTRYECNELSQYQLALCFYRLWNFEEALLYVEKSLKLASADMQTLYFKGAILNALGRKEEGKRCQKEAKETEEKWISKPLDIDAFYRS